MSCRRQLWWPKLCRMDMSGMTSHRCWRSPLCIGNRNPECTGSQLRLLWWNCSSRSRPEALSKLVWLTSRCMGRSLVLQRIGVFLLWGLNNCDLEMLTRHYLQNCNCLEPHHSASNFRNRHTISTETRGAVLGCHTFICRVNDFSDSLYDSLCLSRHPGTPHRKLMTISVFSLISRKRSEK